MRLRAAIGRTAHTAALLDGRVASDFLTFDFDILPAITRAFAPMVRDGAYDVSEIALLTILQALACGKPLTLLPIVLTRRLPHASLLCRADGPVAAPADLVGRRIGVRAYSQTTALWLRAVLAETHGIAPERMRWTTFEPAHVAEVIDPPWAERAPAGADLLAMLHDGTLDAAIVGSDAPDDPALRPLLSEGEARAYQARLGLVPVNHMLCLRRDLATAHPGLAPELTRLITASASIAGAELLPTGLAAVRPAVDLALAYAQEQGLLPHPLTSDAVWNTQA